MYREDFRRYLDDLASNKPVPGGGSASGLVSSLGVALLSMACNFTSGKEKYKDVEEKIREVSLSLDNLLNKLENLIDEDVASYQNFLESYKLSRNTTQERQERARAIQEALKRAIDVPLKICEFSLEALRLSRIVAEKANPDLITDVGGGVLFLEAGFESALLNVVINLKSLKDKELKEEIKKKIELWKKEITEVKEIVLKEVKGILEKTGKDKS